jgi:large subunit ribosomal protein L23
VEEKVLIQPIVSEKSFKSVADENVYTFKVSKNSNKMDISDAIEKEFDVTVEKVRVVNVRPRIVKFGKARKTGYRSSWKKALVKLSSGDKIEIFDIN